MSQTDTATSEEGSIESYLDEGKPKKWYKRKRWWALALLVILVAVGITQCSGGNEAPNYITAEVETRSLDLSVTATGSLRPTNQVEVGSEISGRIDRVLVDVNDQVNRGQLLAVINTEVIGDQIRQSRANLTANQAQVGAAQATLDGDQAQLNRLLEVQRLSDGRVPSEAEIDLALAAVNRGRANVAAAQANVAAARAQLSSSQVSLDRATIRSPVSGVVLARQVEPGQTVVASFNTPTLFVLAEDLSIMQLRVALDEADVGQVEAGQDVTFTVDAYPGRRFPATVERVDLASNNISLQGQQQQQGQQVVSYEARLTVGNNEGLLRPGMTATATIATQSTGEQTLVPNSALRFNPNEEDEGGGIFGDPDFGLEQNDEATIGVGSRQMVYVVEEDGTLRGIEVVTGQSDGRMTVVTSDELTEDMEVVTGISAGEQ